LLTPQNFSQKLIQWFESERAQIPVPGRGVSDPYTIWIAEVMLQQTQVSTVWPYYKRWLEAFPDIGHLANASLDQVLKLWEGLGYYSRARNLHKAAGYVREHFDGQIPQSIKQLIQIPGIGPYTAAAIASFAFQEPVPLIDGNVLRVLSRVQKLGDDITKTQTKNNIMLQLEKLIPNKNPGSFNQGLMDLGRVHCTPKRPECEKCPVSEVCQAFQDRSMEAFPVKPPKRVTPHYDIVIGIIRKDERVLIQKRPPKGLLGGLWEFPGGKMETGESPEAAVLREIKEETGLGVTLGEAIGTIRHAYTHFKITLSAFFCDWTEGEAKLNAATENRWIPMHEIDQYAFPKANLKILEQLKK